MDIIFGRQNAEQLRNKYTVLDLETVHKDGVSLEVFCLIPADKLTLTELPQLENWIRLHNDFLQGWQTQQYAFCLDCIEHLRGKFGGELDSFYDEISTRIAMATVDTNQTE